MFAIAGVTGHTGGAAADALINAGEPVRVIVRNAAKGDPWRARGAEVAVASMDDGAALARALAGTRGAYLLVAPTYTNPDPLGAQGAVSNAISNAVRDSDVGHVVFLSSQGAQHATGTGPVRALHDAEGRLRNTGKPVTLLRASYFLENWVGVLGAVRTQGILPSFIPLDLPIETIATADIGGKAADLLRGPAPAAARVVEISGPRPLSPRDVASSLSAAIGRTIAPVAAPIDQVVPTFTGIGASRAAAELFHEMYEAIASGRLAFEDSNAPHFRGTRTPADVLAPVLR